MIQIDIEIPKSCADCPLCHCKGKDDPWNYYCSITMDDINIEEWDNIRYNTCPLKEVPTESLTEPCEDCISRQGVLDIVDSYSESQSNIEDVTQDIISDIMALPSVNSQPKTGHWIPGEKAPIECDRCGYGVMPWNNTEYCPNCGCRMFEPKKGE